MRDPRANLLVLRANLRVPRANHRVPRANLKVSRANQRVARANLRVATSHPGQEVVSDTPALLNDLYKELSGSRAAAPKGTKSCRTQREFLSV